MKFDPILIVAGEPNSIFLEIFFKSLKKINIKRPIILISSINIVKLQMKKLNFKIGINLINYEKLKKHKLNNKLINLIDINYNQKKPFKKISIDSKIFLEKSFNLAFDLIKKHKIKRFINGPISKKYFLQKKFLGVTEYISTKFSRNDTCMLIFNKSLSVCPITTHLPIKLVNKKIKKMEIVNKTLLIQSFYKKFFKIKPKIAILGLNPHCESILKFNEDEKIIKPAIKILKKKSINISGPISSDTAFIKNIRKNYDIIIGMYHDQVLTPIKTLYEYDAINITLGLPFLRVSPDHGPNEKMMGKNLSNPLSLIQAIKFLDKNW